VGDGLNRYAFTSDFERWLETCPLLLRARPWFVHCDGQSCSPCWRRPGRPRLRV